MPKPGSQDWDVLGQLLPMSFRGVEVPCIRMGASGSNRLAEHEQYDVPGADIENGNRKAVRYTFTVPFRRLIVGYTDLYPRVFRQFLKAVLNPAYGTLVHPEFGEVDAYVADWSFEWVAEKRDGCDMQVTFIETNENGRGLENVAPSIVDAQRAALDLEAMFKDADPPITYADPSGLSLSEQLAKIASLKLLAQLEIAAALGEINRVLDATNNLLDMLSSLSGAGAALMYSTCLQVSDSVQSMGEKLSIAGTGKKIAQRINEKERTAAETAAHFGLSSGDFYTLNPAVARTGTVPEGAQVFVYEGR